MAGWRQGVGGDAARAAGAPFRCGPVWRAGARVFAVTLRELQARLFAAVGPAAACAGSPDPVLLAAVQGGPALGPEARLAIYADMYMARLLDVVREDYPRVVAVLTPERFEVVVRAYLAATPSRHPSVRWVGDRFADFLGAGGAAGAPAWISDLARLEWLRGEVFDAADAPPLTLERLRAVPAEEWGGLPLSVVPAVRTMSSAWPVHEAWDVASPAPAEPEPIADADPPAGPTEAAPVELVPAPTTLRIWRQEFAVYHVAMRPAEAEALRRLLAGEGFGAACDAIAEQIGPEDAPREAGGLLLRWIEDGILADLPPC
ncbi:MAG TPA: putative DNA-binding domain-containing protein [Candidatus Binatia bacterium]|nr:putative DNA-binding domain-containing protein [Candidatus Binatia bacterium]